MDQRLQSVYSDTTAQIFIDIMDICDDWGEGSGLEIWDTDCNSHTSGKQNQLYFYFRMIVAVIASFVFIVKSETIV